MTAERWKVASGTEGRYEVSDHGQVRRSDGLLLTPSVPRNTREYPCVMLRHSRTRRRVAVHRLVAINFIGLPPFAGAEVRHLDGNHLNPRWDNLAWGSRKDNAADRDAHGTTARGDRHGIRGRDTGGTLNSNAKLSEAQVAEIVRLSGEGYAQRHIAKLTGASQRTVWAIVSGKSYQAAALRARAAIEGD